VLPDCSLATRNLQFVLCYLSIQRMRDVDESLPVGKWAYGLMLAFLICLLAVSWAVAVDWQSRHELEQISQPTAVGDPNAVGFDAKRDQAKEVVRWNGTAYYPVPSGVTSLAEYNAVKIGVDDSGKISVYQARRPTQEHEIIVKIGANQFLRLASK
jgi:hypothetical protein